MRSNGMTIEQQMIHCYPLETEKLRKVFGNIAGKAPDAIRNGGTVCLRTREALVDSTGIPGSSDRDGIGSWEKRSKPHPSEQRYSNGVLDQREHYLGARRILLANCGYEVCSASTAIDAGKTILPCGVHLVILCHLHSGEECDPTLAFTHLRSLEPKSPTLMARWKGCYAEMLSQIFDTMDEPANSVPTVETTCARRRQSTLPCSLMGEMHVSESSQNA